MGLNNVDEVKGQRIASAELIRDYELAITFDGGATLRIRDDGQSCCEHRYMAPHSHDLTWIIGKTFLDARVAGSGYSEEHGADVEFLEIVTGDGVISIPNYNDHNGYYGGFSVTARVRLP